MSDLLISAITYGHALKRWTDGCDLWTNNGRPVRTILATNVLGPIDAVIVYRFFALHALAVLLPTRSRARRQLPIEPGLRQGPFTLDRRRRDAERFGRLVDVEPSEESQLHDPTLPVID